MGFKDRIKKINIKGIWERNAFYILLGACILIMGAVAWTSRSRQQPAPPAPAGEQQMAVTPFPELEIERRDYTLQVFPEIETEEDIGHTEESEENNEENTGEAGEAEEPGSLDTGIPEEEVSSQSSPAADPPGEEPEEPAVETAAQVSGWVTPLPGVIVTRYASDQLVYWETLGAWRVHAAIDIKPERDTAVFAAADGTVSLVAEDDMLGHMIVIDHEGGFQTCYASLAEDIPVIAGDMVIAGQQIGTAGDSARSERVHGIHLHFAVWRDGQSADPLSYISVP